MTQRARTDELSPPVPQPDASVGVLALGADQRVLEANGAIAELLDVDEHALIGHRLSETVRCDDAHALAHHLEECLSTGKACTHEWRLHTGAQTRVIEMLTLPAEGGARATVSACRDISARIGPQGALRLLEALGERLLGVLDLREAATRVVQVLVPGFAAGAAIEWAVEAGGGCVRLAAESVETGGQGEVRLPLAQAGQPRGALVLREPPARQVAWRQLAVEVARRTELALAAASRHAECERAVRHRDEMVAMLSHDLRNALASAGMNCQLLSRDVERGNEDPAPRKRRLAAIQRAVDWMNELSEDLLDKRALEQGRIPLSLAPLDAGALCREAADLHEPAAAARGIRVRVEDRAADEPRINTDRKRLLQVLDNLVANAVSASPDGAEVTLTVDTLADALRISVRDGGAGIPSPPGDPDAIFRGLLRRSDAHGHVRGLGLPIAHALVLALGGRLTFENLPTGSVFHITLGDGVH
jgi:signal transduction histidine kinase